MTAGDDALPRSEGSESTDLVQLLVEDPGNRRAIERMLEGHFEVLTDRSVADADLYLLEDRLLDRYRGRLRERVETDHPTFCPVVVIRRSGSPHRLGALDDRSEGRPLLVDETVDAPIDETQLVRRLQSLLVRRTQSAELTEYVSALEERERDLRRFDRAVEATRNAVAILDTDGCVEYVNPAFEAFSGYTGTEMIDRPLRTLQTDQADDPFDESFWRTLGDGSGWEGEIVVERTDGEQRVAATTLAAIERNGGVVGFVAVLRDVTERIQRERTLRERQDELDLLRQVLTRYLRHNLGNGLNVIRGHAELLAETASSPETNRSADAIVEQTDRLIETSDTARRYSSLIDRGGEPSEYDLSAVLEETVAEIDSAYPSVSVTVDAPETCTVIAGRGIEQAVGGLVENAAKHNDADDPWVRVRVRVRVGPRNGARLTIEDNGPGIPDHDLAAFEQGTESSLEHSSGVGIWLSKWVIEGAGGTLSFDSTPEGMRVSVEFPPPSMVGSDGLDVSDLKARERRLRTVIDRMTDAVIEVDDSWTVTFVDDRAGSILGIDADAATGSDFFDVFPDAEDPAFEDACREAMDARSSAGAEGYHGSIDAWLSAYFYPDLNGGLSVYFRDTTDRNLREQKLRRHATIVEALDDPVYALDDEGRFEYVNDAFVDMVGYDRETIIGEGPELIKSERAHELGVENLRGLLAEDAPTSVTFEIEIEPASGDPIPCEDRMSVLRYDEASFDGSVGVLRDVSDRVEREDRLRGLNETNRELIAADSAEEIADIAVRAAEDILGLEASAVHLRDGDRRLVPVATTDAIRELIGEPPALGEGGSIAWRAYEASEPLIVEDVQEDRDVHNPDTPIRGELYLPLGEHGVLIAGSETPASFDERDRLFGELLAENAATALAQLDPIDRHRRRGQSRDGGQTDPTNSTDPTDPTDRTES
ncbi:PAS domain S-box protein [Natronomonas sp.]|uniref:PAS domain S-box protein n=1 Tax=Natronomonas sp. TaxID=2184060 RepID=UPI002631BFD6|nr:PAS domain S-box protein [Natronomonas sp.]